jgi:hypothetical protein
MSRDSSVSVATGNGLHGRGLIPGRVKRFFLFHNVKTVSWAHPASCQMGTWNFWGDKVAGTWSWPLSSYCRGQEWWCYNLLPYTSSWHSAYLIKHREHFAVYFFNIYSSQRERCKNEIFKALYRPFRLMFYNVRNANHMALTRHDMSVTDTCILIQNRWLWASRVSTWSDARAK